LTKYLTILDLIYTQRIGFPKLVFFKNIQSHLFSKTHNYKLKLQFDKNYLILYLKLYFNLIKILNLLKNQNKNQVFYKSQIYSKYLIITKQHRLFLISVFNFYFNKSNSYNAKKFRKELLSTFFFKKKNNTFIQINKYSLKNYNISRKLWKKKNPHLYFRLKSTSFNPSRMIIFNLLRTKKQQIQSGKHFKFSKNINIFKQNKRNLIWQKLKKKVRTNGYIKNNKNLNPELIWKKKETLKKTNVENFSLQYRVPYRKEIRTNSLLICKYKLKYLLQKFLKKYLNTHFQIKITNSISEFKNLVFYRFLFKKSNWKKFSEITLKKKKPKNLLLASNSKKSIQKNKISKTQHIYFGSRNIHFLNIFRKKTKLDTKKNIKPLKYISPSLVKTKILKNIIWKNNQIKKIITNNKTFKNYTISLKSNSNFHRNKFETLRQDRKTQNFLKRMFPIIINFNKYLDAQLLVDHIARELEYTKKHWPILYLLKNLLSLFPVQRLIAYRIGIFGRINSSKKARVIFLKKGNLPLQNFTKNINFGLAQSRARIGSFGVKMWIYF